LALGRFCRLMDKAKDLQRGHSTWTCISVEGTKAKLTVALYDQCGSNKIAKVTPDVIFIEVGALRRDGGADIELLGFLASLLGLREDQVSVEPEEQGKARGKKAACEGRFVTLLGLQQSKRELIWLLESKVGQRHDPHFAADSANAARNQGSKQGVARRRELEEFASLRQEALGTQRPSAAEGLFGEPASAVGLKRKAAPDAGGAAAAAKRPSAAKAPAEAAAEEAQPAAQPEATPPAPPGDAAEAASEEEGALGGLAAYDSDEDEEDDEDEKLPPPAL